MRRQRNGSKLRSREVHIYALFSGVWCIVSFRYDIRQISLHFSGAMLIGILYFNVEKKHDDQVH